MITEKKSETSLSVPNSSRQTVVLIVLGLFVLGALVYVFFFRSSASSVTVGEDVSQVGLEKSDDYRLGDAAGYLDGRSETGSFFDSYQEPTDPVAQSSYFEGYYSGFLRGCEEGGFDCSDIENYQNDYDLGYEGGYADGYGENGEFLDSYTGSVNESFLGAYDEGYFDGFHMGCSDGGFDCSDVAAYREKLSQEEGAAGM